MLKTITMNGGRQKIALDRLGVEKEKMANDLTPEDNANMISNSYGQLRAGIVIATDPNNQDNVFVSEWENAEPEDCISLGVGGELKRPLTDVKALNELWVMGTNGDVIYIEAI